MYKRYQDNSGLVRRVEEPFPPPPAAVPPLAGAYPPPKGIPPAGGFPPPPLSGLFGRLKALVPRLRIGLETEDLLILLILYLLYRESGDTEWLVALAAMLFID